MLKKTDILPWLEATRPKTLAASVIPVLIGTSAASTQVNVRWELALVILICAMLIQIFTNYVNEIYDFRSGADREDRVGPRRQVASGNISVKTMSIASAIIFILAFSLGMILVNHAGSMILLVGLLSLIFAFAYTGGPYPLAYNALGDVFVFIFFGLVAVCGTYYVFTGTIDYIALLASLPPGFLSTNILAVNNIRDIKTDPPAGKITLAVKLGRTAAVRLYQVLNISSYASLLLLAYYTSNALLLLPMLTLPLAFSLNKNIATKEGTELNAVLANTGKQLTAFGALLAIGFVLG